VRRLSKGEPWGRRRLSIARYSEGGVPEWDE
jgi:hypothetical protein